MLIRFMYLYAQSVALVKDQAAELGYVAALIKKPVGGLLIAVDEAEDKVYYEVSSLHPRDLFSRKSTRALLKTKFDSRCATAKNNPSKPLEGIELDGEKHRYTITGIVMEDLVDTAGPNSRGGFESGISTSVYRAAKHWLAENPGWSEPYAPEIPVAEDVDEPMAGLKARKLDHLQEMIA